MEFEQSLQSWISRVPASRSYPRCTSLSPMNPAPALTGQ